MNEKILHEKVCEFKTWQKDNYPNVTEENDNGEWVFFEKNGEWGTAYDEMTYEAVNFIKNNSAENISEQVIDDLLYSIARDSECSYIFEEIEKYEKWEWFALLCRKCLQTNYINAKWQFACELKYYKGNDDLKNIIFEFLDLEDEYTQRMALKTIAFLYPEKAENIMKEMKIKP